MKAPSDLSPRAIKLWHYAQRRGCHSPGRLLVLEMALRCLDVADEARQAVARDGIMLTSDRSKLARRHPALVVATEARREFLKLWDELGLAFDEERDERL